MNSEAPGQESKDDFPTSARPIIMRIAVLGAFLIIGCLLLYFFPGTESEPTPQQKKPADKEHIMPIPEGAGNDESR